jgi:hypothetical protein
MLSSHLLIAIVLVSACSVAGEELSAESSAATASPWDSPTQVTAYPSARAVEYLNVGKAVAIDGVGGVHETWLQATATDPVTQTTSGTIMHRRSTDNGLHWTTPLALTAYTANLGSPKIAAFDNNVYIVFHAAASASQVTRPYLVRSADNGAHFSASQQLATTGGIPTVAAFGPFVHVVWSAASPTFAEVFITTSSDSGAHFATPHQVSSSDNRSSWTPSVAAWGWRVVVAWTDERHNTVGTTGAPFDCGGQPGDQCREELYASVSSDAGAHFGAEQRLTNDGATPHATWAPSVAMWGENTIHIAYFERQNDTNFQVYSRRSIDGGSSFEPATLLSDPLSAQSARPSIATFNDVVHLLFYVAKPGGFEIVHRASPDAGRCWSAPVTLAQGIVGEPHPSIAVSPNGWAFADWIAPVAGSGGTQLFDSRRQPAAPTCN